MGSGIPTVLTVLGRDFHLAAHRAGSTTWRLDLPGSASVALIRSDLRPQPWMAMVCTPAMVVSPTAHGDTPEGAVLGLPDAITRAVDRLAETAARLSEMFEAAS